MEYFRASNAPYSFGTWGNRIEALASRLLYPKNPAKGRKSLQMTQTVTKASHCSGWLGTRQDFSRNPRQYTDHQTRDQANDGPRQRHH